MVGFGTKLSLLKLLLASLVLLFSSVTNAQKGPFEISSDDNFYDVTLEVKYFEDVLGERDFDFISEQDLSKFKSPDEIEEFNKKYTYWGYLEINNKNEFASNWYMYFNRNDFIDVFEVRNESVRNLKSGFCYPKSERSKK